MEPTKLSPAIRRIRRVDVRENYQDELGLRRSRMARTIFDQLKIASTARTRRTIFEVINKLMVATDTALARYALLQIRAHQAKNIYTQLLVQGDIKCTFVCYVEINSENTSVDTLLVLRAISNDFVDLFEQHQLELIKSFILRCLETFKKDSVLLLAVEVLALVHASSEFKQAKLREVVRILNLLVKTNRST